MSYWILIIWTLNGGITNIPGFNSQEECREAAKSLPEDQIGYRCVSQEIRSQERRYRLGGKNKSGLTIE